MERSGFSWRGAALVFIFLFFLLGGIGHLVLTDAFVSVVPSYIPFPRPVVLATGLCEIAGAFGLVYAPLRRLAGLALALYTLCVWPVHIDMLIHAGRWKNLGMTFLWGRLLFQPILIWIILAATRRNATTPAA